MSAIPHNSSTDTMKLGIEDFTYADLYRPQRLVDLLESFDAVLKESDPALYAEYLVYRDNKGKGMAPQSISDLLVRLAPHVGGFIARLFHVEDERKTRMAAIQEEVDILFTFRNEITAKLQSKFKDQTLTATEVQDIANRLEILIQAGFPEADREPD